MFGTRTKGLICASLSTLIIIAVIIKLFLRNEEKFKLDQVGLTPALFSLHDCLLSMNKGEFSMCKPQVGG